MPIYEYQCSKCGEIFEAFQKISDAPLTRCRECGAKLERLISHTSFQLKGSGWYLTDYARKSSSSEKASDGGTKPAEKSEKSDNSGSSTSKPEKSSS